MEVKLTYDSDCLGKLRSEITKASELMLDGSYTLAKQICKTHMNCIELRDVEILSDLHLLHGITLWNENKIGSVESSSIAIAHGLTASLINPRNFQAHLFVGRRFALMKMFSNAIVYGYDAFDRWGFEPKTSAIKKNDSIRNDSIEERASVLKRISDGEESSYILYARHLFSIGEIFSARKMRRESYIISKHRLENLGSGTGYFNLAMEAPDTWSSIDHLKVGLRFEPYCPMMHEFYAIFMFHTSSKIFWNGGLEHMKRSLELRYTDAKKAKYDEMVAKLDKKQASSKKSKGELPSSTKPAAQISNVVNIPIKPIPSNAIEEHPPELSIPIINSSCCDEDVIVPCSAEQSLYSVDASALDSADSFQVVTNSSLSQPVGTDTNPIGESESSYLYDPFSPPSPPHFFEDASIQTPIDNRLDNSLLDSTLHDKNEVGLPVSETRNGKRSHSAINTVSLQSLYETRSIRHSTAIHIVKCLSVGHSSLFAVIPLAALSGTSASPFTEASALLKGSIDQKHWWIFEEHASLDAQCLVKVTKSAPFIRRISSIVIRMPVVNAATRKYFDLDGVIAVIGKQIPVANKLSM